MAMLTTVLVYAQGCVDVFSIKYNKEVVVLDSFPANMDTLAKKHDKVFVLCEKENEGNWDQAVFLVSRSENKWYMWAIVDWSTSYFRAELQLITIDGVREPLIYLKWSELDMGSGMGTSTVSKELWSRNGARCYLDAVTRSTYIYKDKYGPNASYKTFTYKYYCPIKISYDGLKITDNNTCEDRFNGIESGKQSCYSMVTKYQPGMYIFENGQWKKE